MPLELISAAPLTTVVPVRPGGECGCSPHRPGKAQAL
jgi:hypothetical protein